MDAVEAWMDPRSNAGGTDEAKVLLACQALPGWISGHIQDTRRVAHVLDRLSLDAAIFLESDTGGDVVQHFAEAYRVMLSREGRYRRTLLMLWDTLLFRSRTWPDATRRSEVVEILSSLTSEVRTRTARVGLIDGLARIGGAEVLRSLDLVKSNGRRDRVVDQAADAVRAEIIANSG